jgi:hypothetical protein
MDRGGAAVIRVRPRREPKGFHERCRERGRRWLAEHPDYNSTPRDYWSEFEPQLRDTFKGLCGYCAMWVGMKGEVDHFVPVSIFKSERQHHLAYEWSNFRYCAGTMNQRKKAARVLDPFEVEDDWFRILLPSLQLVLTDKVPDDIRPLAEFTLEQLGLRDQEAVIRYRREWFRLYRLGRLELDELRRFAPLLARAIEADRERGKHWRLPPGHADAEPPRGDAPSPRAEGRAARRRRGRR